MRLERLTAAERNVDNVTRVLYQEHFFLTISKSNCDMNLKGKTKRIRVGWMGKRL